MSENTETQKPKTAPRPKVQPKELGTANPEAAAPVVRAPVKIRNRHDVSFRHDCFKSSAEECFRNFSYEFLKPKLERIQHMHVYHSHNNSGKVLTRTGSACNHWHDVKTYIHPETGEPFAECGPPMHEVTEVTQTGRTVKRVEQVSFDEEIMTGPDAGKIKRLVDDHTHTMEYLGSEELTPAGITKELRSQQAEAAAMGIVLGSGSVTDKSPAPLVPSDGVTMVEA